MLTQFFIIVDIESVSLIKTKHVSSNKLYSVEVTPHHQEVEYGKNTTVTCEISGQDGQVKLTWIKGGVAVEPDNYVEEKLDHRARTGESGYLQGNQTETLYVREVETDTVLTCRVSSLQFPSSPYSDTSVNLTVYSKSYY